MNSSDFLFKKVSDTIIITTPTMIINDVAIRGHIDINNEEILILNNKLYNNTEFYQNNNFIITDKFEVKDKTTIHTPLIINNDLAINKNINFSNNKIRIDNTLIISIPTFIIG
jgi:CRISPR/Cas system CSM-associated protein Csm5 (group 7 of RAMP superfamily)